MTGLRAGCGVTTITPRLGTPMAGYFHHREARTIEDDLHARALVLDDGQETLIMVVCDIISIPESLSRSARIIIADRLEVPASAVMISATHTHSGPLLDIGWRLFQDRGEKHENAVPSANGMVSAVVDPSYIEWMAVRIADAATVAYRALQPARIAVGTTTVDGICFNRRFHMRDGTVIFNPGFQNPDIVEVAGPIDPELIAMVVEDEDRKPIALWSTLSLHYVGCDEDRALSADYYGHFAREIERQLGCIGILANGTSGNINNVDVQRRAAESGSVKAKSVAKSVAAAAIASVLTVPRTNAVQLGACSQTVQLDRYPVTRADVAAAQSILDGEGGRKRNVDERFSFEVGQRLPDGIEFAWSNEVVRLAALPEQDSVEVQGFSLGEFAVVALPGEVFVEFGLETKRRSPFTSTAVLGLSNEHHGYLPNLAAFAQGGYETFRSRMNWTAPGSGERLVDAACAALDTLAGRGVR